MATMPVISPQSIENGAAAQRISATPLLNAALIALWLFLSIAAGKLWFGYSSDYYEYLIYYQSIPVTFSLLDTRFEPGFHGIAWVFRTWLRADIEYLITLLSALSLGIKFYLFRKHLKYGFLACIIYVILLYPIHEYTQYRVGLSLALGYLAIHLCLGKRYWWAIAASILSLSFHYSSLALLLAAAGIILIRGRAILLLVPAAIMIVLIILEQVSTVFSDIATRLNPLSGSYLDNKAMIEGVSIFSVNNLLLIAMIASYGLADYYRKSQYHGVFLILSLVSLVPIVLIPEAPVVAQRTKEVFLLSTVFLACRSELRLIDIPGFGFLLGMTGLLGYLWVSGGIILN